MFPALLQVLPAAAAEDLAVGEHGHYSTRLQVLESGPEHLPAGEGVRTNCSR